MASPSSNFPFKGEVKNYRYQEISTPFQKVGQNFDNKIGKFVADAKNFRFIAFIITLINLFLVILLTFLISNKNFSIFTVEMIKSGFVKKVGFLENSKFTSNIPYTNFVNDLLKIDIKNENNLEFLKSIMSTNSFSTWINWRKVTSDKNYSLSNINIQHINDKKYIKIVSFEFVDNKKYIVQFILSKKYMINREYIKLNPFAFYIDEINIKRTN